MVSRVVLGCMGFGDPHRGNHTWSIGPDEARPLIRAAIESGLLRAALPRIGAAGLARALALDPAILLVDEPSAGLDPITADEIDELLLGLKHDGRTTLVIVTHNIPSAKRLGDEIVMLHDGRIVARGAPADLEQSANEMVRAFMHSQHAG